MILIPRSLHPHWQWWLLEDNVLTGQPLHPIKHALEIFTDASKEGWGTHLNKHTARGSWPLPESKLHINYVELKEVFLAWIEFQDVCNNVKIVLVATDRDNTTLVSYINKEADMRSDPLCALLWRILTRCTRHQVTLKARHIPGRLNVVADKVSCLGQIIQTEWSLLQEVFQAICSRWHRPKIDLFAARFNNKLPQFVSNLSLVLHQLTKAPFELIQEASLKNLTFKTVFLLALGSGKRRGEIHACRIKISGTNLIGQRFPCIHHPASSPRTSWPKKVQTVWPQWLYQPWPQLWTGPSSLTGSSAQSELYATTWTGPQTSGRIRSWSLSPSISLPLEITQHLHPILLEGCGLG